MRLSITHTDHRHTDIVVGKGEHIAQGIVALSIWPTEKEEGFPRLFIPYSNIIRVEVIYDQI